VIGISVIGLSHRTARVEVRERFALDAEARAELARQVCAEDGVHEALVLSTCNRTEIYAVGAPGLDVELPNERLRELLLAAGRESGAAPSDFAIRIGADAVTHAFEVAAGLDSMVLGETQILGQVKQAYQEAVDTGHVGPGLRKLFPTAFRLAKRAHTETAISEGAASVGSIAVELAGKVFGDLDRRTVLLLGAGDTGETIALALGERKVARLWIAGRGEERSARLAERCAAQSLPLEVALAGLAEADIVLTAAHTPTRDFLLAHDRLAAAIAARRGGPLLVVDVGVPRNVDPAARDLADLFLYDLDDLESVAEETRRRRRGEVVRAEAILAEGIDAFAAWWRAAAGVAPLLRDLHARLEETRRRELARTLEKIPQEHHAVIERFSRSLLDKLLQAPTIELRRGDDALHKQLDVVRKLFGLRQGGGGDEP
jgi:glutamyl-tRNA reductase